MNENIRQRFLLGICLSIAAINTGNTAEPVTVTNFQNPGDNRVDEPLATEFSVLKASAFLDSASLAWQKERQCFTCHTNYAHLYARPSSDATDSVSLEVRRCAEELITKRWEENGPRWDAEIIASAAALAFNDSATTGHLHPVTRKALDRMFTVQREDGGFNWLKCNWPPMESDDHYGATLAVIAIGVAPDKYSQTDAAQRGLEKLRGYLKENPAPTVHHQAMIAWSDSYIPGILSPEEKEKTLKELRALQKADGGWGLATLGDWKRGDSKSQDLESSDGYGTGFVVYVLRRCGVPANDPQIERGIAWLKTHQRESGRWFTRSLFKDNKHYITHAGTAFALMALHECDVK